MRIELCLKSRKYCLILKRSQNVGMPRTTSVISTVFHGSRANYKITVGDMAIIAAAPSQSCIYLN